MNLNELQALKEYNFPGIGVQKAGNGDCDRILRTDDKKAIVVLWKSGERCIHFPTDIGVPTFYPLPETKLPRKISAVLMDLDGTSVHSEHFWIWVIREVVIALRNDRKFTFTDADLPHVSGYSVSEHLQYCLDKYCKGARGATLPRAREIYFDIVHRELRNVLDGKPVVEPAFEPAPKLKEFLCFLRKKGVKIGLVSSGLYEKSIPEIKAAFDKLRMGDPVKFYDGIVTAGFSIRKGQVGTLGELEPKPHPWLYSEAMHALHVTRNEVLGMEDSGAGVLSLVTAGIPAIGIGGGNIVSGGEKGLCSLFFDDLPGAFDWFRKKAFRSS